jgi:hypothetical protein
MEIAVLFISAEFVYTTGLIRRPNRANAIHSELTYIAVAPAVKRAVGLYRASEVITCRDLSPTRRGRALLHWHTAPHSRAITELAGEIPAPAKELAVSLDRTTVTSARCDLGPISRVGVFP